MRTIQPTYGLWVVLGYHGTNERGQHLWRCCCACGREEVRLEYTLTLGRSRSCRPCSARSVADRVHTTHGLSSSLVYRRWQAMKTRCGNPRAKSWKYHGGAGVRVAPEWLSDFEAFYEHIGEPPTPMHTVDRIDPFGDYKPGNVRWATQSEQMANTRRSKSGHSKR